MKKTSASFIVLATLCLACVSVLSLACGKHNESSANPASCDINQDAFVYILNMGMTCSDNPGFVQYEYKQLADGFAVGSGKYIVTAAHCVQDFENSPYVLRQPIVISPYYGDLFEARIVAVDETNDVAVLEAAWEVHPALELETGDAWKSGNSLLIVGYPPPDAKRGGDEGRFSRNIRTEKTRLRNVKGDGAYKVQLGPVKLPGKGWSGSPFINPQSVKVVGVLSREHYLKRWFMRKDHLILGGSVDSINQLFAERDLQMGDPATFTASSAASQRFDRILGALDEILDPQASPKRLIQDLCEEFPHSYLSYLLADWCTENDDYLLHAIELAPDSTLLKATYGRNLMCRKRYQEAAEQFQSVIDREPDHLFANYGLLVSLARIDPEKAEALGETLTEKWPDNEILWFEYSRVFRARKKRPEQLAAIQTAIALSDDIPYLYQRHLADALMENEEYESSEQTYAALLETHECEDCWRAYAALLSKMGSNNAALAEVATKKADSLQSKQQHGTGTD